LVSASTLQTTSGRTWIEPLLAITSRLPGPVTSPPGSSTTGGRSHAGPGWPAPGYLRREEGNGADLSRARDRERAVPPWHLAPRQVRSACAGPHTVEPPPSSDSGNTRPSEGSARGEVGAPCRAHPEERAAPSRERPGGSRIARVRKPNGSS